MRDNIPTITRNHFKALTNFSLYGDRGDELKDLRERLYIRGNASTYDKELATVFKGIGRITAKEIPSKYFTGVTETKYTIAVKFSDEMTDYEKECAERYKAARARKRG